MPEETFVGEESDVQLSPLEARLSPEQIAELDEMNARVFGAGASPEGDGGPAAPPPPKPPAPAAPDAPKPAADKPVVTAGAPVADLPPDDGVAPTVTEPPPPPTVEFPDAKELFPDDAIGKLRTEKAKADISGLREHYSKAVHLVSDLRKENDSLKKAGGPTGDAKVQIDDLLQRNADLSAIVERAAAREHPWLKNNIEAPRAREVAKGEKALEYAKMKKEDFLQAIAMPEGADRIAAFDAIYDSIESPTLRSQVEKAVAEIERLDEQRSAWLADREGNSAKIAAEEKSRQAEQLQQQEAFIKQSIDRTIEYLGSKSPFFRKSGGKAGYENWDKNFDDDRAFVEEMALRNEDPLKLLGVLYAGVRSSRVMAAYERRGQIIADLNKTITELRGGRPRLNGETVDTDPGERPLSQVQGDLVAAARQAIHQVSSG